MMKSIKVCSVKYAVSQKAMSQASQGSMGYKAISELEKVDSKDEGTCRIRYLEAELEAKKKENQSHIIYMLGITEKQEPKCYFFAVLTSYANGTFLTRQTSYMT